MELNGVIDLLMKDGRHYTLDDPGQTVVIQAKGSISVVANSPDRMAELRSFQQDALQSYAAGHNANPTNTGGGGSSTPPSAQPINFFHLDQQDIFLIPAPAATGKAPPPVTTTGGDSKSHIPGPPGVVIHNGTTREFTFATSPTGDGPTAMRRSTPCPARSRYTDLNVGDKPTASVTIDKTAFTYLDASGKVDLTAQVNHNAQWLADVYAVEVDLVVTQDPNPANNGSATWTYTVPDNKFDFLAQGETLTLTYTAEVQNHGDTTAGVNEKTFKTFTITITGTNDVPVITTGPQTINFAGGKGTPGGDLIPTRRAPVSM